MKKKVCYVAGPYSVGNVKENIKRARLYALHLWFHGFACICPHLNTSLFEEHEEDYGMSYETWLTGDEAMIERCDVLFVMPGWEVSSGTKREIAHAQKNDVPVLYLHEINGISDKLVAMTQPQDKFE